MSRKKGDKEAVKDEMKQEVKDDSKPETTEEVKSEVREGVNGSVDGSTNLPINAAPIKQPSSSLPAIPFQPETFLPAILPPELELGWVAPVNWGLEERVERVEKIGYWADGISRLDAGVTKWHGEALWYCRDWFRQRKEQIKEEGKKLKAEKLTWTKLLSKKKWDRATVSRKINFYLKHRNTPDDQLDGQSICNMWPEDRLYMSDPPALGQFYRETSNCREVISDERGKTLSTRMNLEKGTVIEVVGFNDGAHLDTVMRIKSGKHAGKCFTTKGNYLSVPVDPAEVPKLVKAIDDAGKTKKTKTKKPKSEGVIACSPPPADAPFLVFRGDDGDQPEEGENVQDATWTAVESPLSEDFKEGFAQLESFMASLERFKPTRHEYTLMGKKLDEVCSYFDEMQSLQDAPPPEALQTVD